MIFSINSFFCATDAGSNVGGGGSSKGCKSEDDGGTCVSVKIVCVFGRSVKRNQVVRVGRNQSNF